MDLTRISVVVRPRSPYEAVDLGVVMARQWFFPLLWLAVLPTLPVMLLLFYIFQDAPWWAALAIWWIKPLWESLQLQFIGRAMFNPQTDWKLILKQAHRYIFRNLFAELFIRRWSLSRSFDMPVSQLENLQKEARRRRLSALHRDSTSTSIWLTLLGNAAESMLLVSIFGLFWLLLPTRMEVDFSLEDMLTSVLLFPALAWGAWAAMILVSPFYVCCGFMLYINRRIWLEAWDVELAFRHLANRTVRTGTPMASLLLLLLLPAFLFLPTNEATANTLTPAESQQQIIKILESDDFNQMQEKRSLRWIESSTDKNDESWWQQLFSSIGKWLTESPWVESLLEGLKSVPDLLELLLWGTLIALVLFLLHRFHHSIFPPSKIGPQTTQPPIPPTHLFGLELNQEKLPDDVASHARHLWQTNPREALGLLYRAALTHLVQQDQVRLEDCHTESECAALCQPVIAPQRWQYFRGLTNQWITLAYAHQVPATTDFEQLCAQWSQFAANRNHHEAP